jgi:hypothetical protein
VLGEHSRWFREAASAGTALNAGRRSALQKKRHALAARSRQRREFAQLSGSMARPEGLEPPARCLEGRKCYWRC